MIKEKGLEFATKALKTENKRVFVPEIGEMSLCESIISTCEVERMSSFNYILGRVAVSYLIPQETETQRNFPEIFY